MKTRSATILATIITALVAFTSASDTLAQGTWTTEASMPTAREALAGAQVNGVVYDIGGANTNGGFYTLATVEAYDPATDMWSSKAAMPTARYGLAAAAVNGIVYAIGGNPGGYGGPAGEYFLIANNTFRGDQSYHLGFSTDRVSSPTGSRRAAPVAAATRSPSPARYRLSALIGRPASIISMTLRKCPSARLSRLMVSGWDWWTRVSDMLSSYPPGGDPSQAWQSIAR